VHDAGTAAREGSGTELEHVDGQKATAREREAETEPLIPDPAITARAPPSAFLADMNLL